MELIQDLNQVDPAGHVVEDPELMNYPATEDYTYEEDFKQELGNDIDSSSIEQLQKSNHVQYNCIQKLKKDCDYWQKKCLTLTLDNQVVEFDLKKAKKAKIACSKENKSLKETTSQLLNSAKEEQNKELEELRQENEKLTARLKEAEAKVSVPREEQEIINDFTSIQDLPTMMRVLQACQMQFNQKQYAFMLNQQKSAGMGDGSNGVMPTADMMMNGGYMMAPQMMNQMQYNMGMFQSQPENNGNAPAQK
ncbi:unnamed protein product [Moneuplotes crassus]|uniref:Uncharacterized protein n=1 Tax=Euplotes crassus TaxID=5936 RepID=A0AAD1XS09_EUPCR|nr:unnamed protein product [Moneuplotes crassus]